MDNSDRFSRLKKKIGGNREYTGFEYSFGMPKEQQWHITPPNKNIRRIISEIEFALKLNKENGGAFNKCIADALDIIEVSLRNDGVVTIEACKKAEEMLFPIKTSAKEYSLILCGHAHIDMNWMWGWNETVAATLSTFHTMLDLMNEYPGFTFSQSQTAVYRLVEEYEPELMEKIRQRIKEGRWEVASTAWVETDKNMPTGESLLNTVSETRKYLERVWGIPPDSLMIDFSPDTFGHSRHIPEIDKYCGIKYYYHCRGYQGNDILYRYRAPSGAEIMMYCEPYWYNSAITPHIGIGLLEVSKRMQGLKTGLIVYGVGNHGGGVTRKDIECALEMMEWPIFPKIKFGTFREFFEAAEAVREKLPIVDKELNYIFTGCYTSQSRIKRANRLTEAALIESQTMSSLASVYTNSKFNFSAFEAAWRNTLFTHFHDIITGSCVRDSREYAMGLYQTAKAHIETEENIALRALSENIDCSMVVRSEYECLDNSQSEGAGVGYGVSNYSGVPNPERGAGITRVFNIFNPTSTSREDVCELTIWDWTGDIHRIKVEDVTGNPVDFATVDNDFRHYWDHKYIRVLVKVKVEAYGYTTVVLSQSDIEEYPFYLHNFELMGSKINSFNNNCVLENEYIRVELDEKTMSIISLIDKSVGSEKIDSTQFTGLVNIKTQCTDDSAWQIGKYLEIIPVTDLNKVEYFSFGNIRKGYRFEAKIMNSTISGEIVLDSCSTSVRYHLNVEWNEVMEQTVPLLAIRVPVKYDVEKYLCDVPMGVIFRGSANHDIPVNSYIAAVGGDNSPLFVSTDSTYGYRGFDNTIVSSLINTSHYPDPAPERGMHEINVLIGIGAADPKIMGMISEKFMHPLRYVPVNPHKGILPPTGVLIDIKALSTNITAITKKENGNLLVRMNEICGNYDNVAIRIAKDIKEARIVDFDGKIIEGCNVENNTVSVKVKPSSIVAIEIRL